MDAREQGCKASLSGQEWPNANGSLGSRRFTETNGAENLRKSDAAAQHGPEELVDAPCSISLFFSVAREMSHIPVRHLKTLCASCEYADLCAGIYTKSSLDMIGTTTVQTP
jgi:hypothetical protein